MEDLATTTSNTKTDDNLIVKNENFICGVVEGFYGRPWTTEQRKDLFRKLKKWGMTSYVYAPKDDYKHRAYWRELYTVEEADHLTSLISAAKEQNIVFYYALSPGLDITYSSAKEISALKRKLEQVSQFGCNAFALLFDDIESEMTKGDKEVFQSFAHAQVSITNEVYNYLSCPKFLFCPTQYCSSRAIPSVTHSEYLNTLGSKLAQDIDVMWTGPKVISKHLSVESIQEITEVLRRPPVIWDNIHANDYDQKRVFLGPYSGRSPELIPLLRGVVTNPNCEFHANTIAIHTLAHWSKCCLDTKICSSLSADIKLETENEEGVYSEEAPLCLSKNVYHPRQALKNAIIDWLPEFFIEKEAWGPITKPQPAVTMVMPIIPIIPSVNTCMSLTTTTSTSTNTSTMSVPEVNTSQLQALADVCSTVSEPLNPMPNIVMNSLVSATKVVTNESIPNPIVSSVINITIPSKMPISSLQVPIMSLKQEEIEKQKIDKSDEEDLNIIKTITNESFIKTNDKIKQLNNDINNDESNITDNKSNKLIENQINEFVVLNNDNNMIDEIEEHHVKENNVNNCKMNNDEKTNDDIEKMNIVEENVENSSPTNNAEPMECASSVTSLTSPKHMTKSSSDDIIMSENASVCSGTMQVESSELSSTSNDMIDEFDRSDKKITEDDLSLLCDLFYLPFEHGSKALQILNEFYWLKTNANVIIGNTKKRTDSCAMKPEVQEWYKRSERFSVLCKNVLTLAKKIALCANKEICYDLFSYIWDVTGVVSLMNAFIKWLALGHFPSNINSYTQGSYTWFSKGWKETFTSGDQEPWVFRGGLIADLQRLLPIDSGNDLFLYKLPDVPSPNFCTIRPYNSIDEEEFYSICHQTCNDGSECTDVFPENLKDLPGDRLVGPFITINPELCMVFENSDYKVIGYACAALDAKIFYRNQEMCWFPAMCLKYPLTVLDTPDITSSTKDLIEYFHNFQYECPTEVITTHPSIMTCCILKEYVLTDNSMAKRLITIVLAALRSNGSYGVHVCINQSDQFMHQFYSKLGFNEIFQDTVTSKVYLGRHF